MPVSYTHLIIDDDKELCFLMKKCVEKENYIAIIANSGAEGLRLASENRNECSLIILDIMLPDLDGFQVLQKIRQTSNVPAVSYTHLFKLYLYTAIAPVPLSAFAGEPSQSVGRSFIKSYAAVCLEGAIIVLACIIFSVFAASPPVVNPDAAAVTMVWSYIGELVFNMLVLVGAVKMADRVVREMMG